MAGYLADSIGSELVESAVDRLEAIIAQIVTLEDLGYTNHFSPGYCEWNVAGQHQLFSLLPKAMCGITLTPSALMIPMLDEEHVILAGNRHEPA